jgi:hypothetical protein
VLDFNEKQQRELESIIMDRQPKQNIQEIESLSGEMINECQVIIFKENLTY